MYYYINLIIIDFFISSIELQYSDVYITMYTVPTHSAIAKIIKGPTSANYNSFYFIMGVSPGIMATVFSIAEAMHTHQKHSTFIALMK